MNNYINSLREQYKQLFSSMTVVAIQNYGSSGTLFIQSLLDNHPQILSIPALYNRTFYDFWNEFEHATAQKSQLVNSFVSQYRIWFHPEQAVEEHGLHQMGEKMNEAVGVSVLKFTMALTRFLAAIEYPSSREFFIGIYMAYAEALGRDISRMRVMVFPIHSLGQQYSQYLYEDFPEAKILHMVRDPVINFGSVIKHIINSNNSGGVTDAALAQICCDHILQWYPEDQKAFGAVPYLPELASNSVAIKLEFLHANLKDTMLKVCHWLEIEWSEQLESSTFDGKKWWNRPGTIRDSGTSQKIANQNYNEYLNSFDRFRLKALNQKKYKEWEYPISYLERSFIVGLLLPLLLMIPFKSEFTTFYHRKKTFNQIIRNISPQVYNFVRFFHYPWTRKKFELNHQKQAEENIYNWLVFWLKFIFLPYILFRDYWMTRYWAFKAWKDNAFSEHTLVKLLEG